MPLTQVSPGLLDSNAQYYGFKNRIINGGVTISQRGTSVTLTAATFTYGPDRWVGYTANTGSTLSQSTDVPANQGLRNSLRFQRPAGNTGVNGHVVQQIIESINMFDLAGQQVTLSFWAKAGANYSQVGSILNCAVSTGTVADQGSASSIGAWTGFAQPINSNVTLTTTWTRYTLTGSIGSSALEMAAFFFWTPSGTAGADDAVYITGVQLEKGSTATSFDYRPYGTELVLCQRYYELYDGAALFLSKIRESTRDKRGNFYYKVTKRVSATLTIITSNADGGGAIGGSSGTDGGNFESLSTSDGQTPVVSKFSGSAEL
jgi:hypothetical protein